MAADITTSPNPRTESTRDVLDVLASSIAQTAARQTKPEPLLQVPAVPVEPNRELLTEKMLADRWVCSVARLQRWRTVGEGPPYLKIVGKVRQVNVSPNNMSMDLHPTGIQRLVLELHHKKLQPEPATEMESEAMA